MYLDNVRTLIKEYKRSSGRDPRREHAIVVDVGGAHVLLRELFFGRLPKDVIVTDGNDELFQIKGIPVRLRFAAPYATAIVAPNAEIPPSTCCDQVAMSSMLICMTRGST